MSTLDFNELQKRYDVSFDVDEDNDYTFTIEIADDHEETFFIRSGSAPVFFKQLIVLALYELDKQGEL
jgi:hypothetical protein